jgi:hypothetical protein
VIGPERLKFDANCRRSRRYHGQPFRNPAREGLPTIRELSRSDSNRNCRVRPLYKRPVIRQCGRAWSPASVRVTSLICRRESSRRTGNGWMGVPRPFPARFGYLFLTEDGLVHWREVALHQLMPDLDAQDPTRNHRVMVVESGIDPRVLHLVHQVRGAG